jgi:hypothetical protein
MEVHAHSHTARKKWTHYFWEFIMLFLAVFCGFLAEYQLEHTIEHQREKQFMKSMVEDMRSDTAQINEGLILALNQKSKMDTLIDIVNNQSLTGDNIIRLYLLHYTTNRVARTNFETRTASQLKNAGGMRLIRNKKVVDSLLYYWKYIEELEEISARIENDLDKTRDAGARIFHNKYIITSDRPLTPPTEVKKDVKFITDDPKLFAEYSNLQYVKRNRTRNHMAIVTEAKERAVQLMEIIRKEYHLK